MAARKSTKKAPRNEQRVVFPASANAAAEQALGWALEWLGVDDNCRIRGELRYARRPGEAAAMLLDRLDEVASIPADVKKRIATTRARLEADLRTTSLDDLDAASLLASLLETAGVAVMDDTTPVDAALEGELRDTLSTAIATCVRDDVSIPRFAETVVNAATGWAKRHVGGARSLRALRDELDASFAGVHAYRCSMDQSALADELTRIVTRMLAIRWIRAESPERTYSPAEAFEPGDRVAHPKLGLGTVVRKLDGKVEIDFGDAVRTLVARG